MTALARVERQALKDKARGVFDELVWKLRTHPLETLPELAKAPEVGGSADVSSLTYIKRFYFREAFCKNISWAIPTMAALEAIQALCWAKSTIYEIGAGLGLWSMLLQRLGVDIVPIDTVGEDYSNYCDVECPPYTTVYPPSHIQGPVDFMMFCWPVYADGWAGSYLAEYEPHSVAYVGEGFGGCTADDFFHELLDDKYDQVGDVDIPQWPGIHDRLTLYRRKEGK